MEDKLKSVIQAARRKTQAVENDENPSFIIPEIRHSPFDCTLGENGVGREGQKRGKAGVSLETSAYQWAEDRLRLSGSMADRTMLAVRDAARVVARKGKDPDSHAFYVAPAIAEGWNLNVRQLSEGLKVLERGGHIRVTERQKGRHLRLVLVKAGLSQSTETKGSP